MTARSSEKEMDEEQWLGQGQDHREECLDTSVGTKCQALQAGRNDKRSWEKRPKPSDTAIKSCQQKDHHELGRMSGELDVDILGSDHVRQKGVVEDEGRREHEAASGGPKEEVAVFATEHRVEEPKHKTNQATTGSNIITHTNDDDGKDRDNEQLWREEQTCVARSRGAPVRPGAGLKVGSGEQHERGAKEGSVMLDMGHGKEEGEHGDEDRQEHAIADEDEKTEGEEDTSVPELVRIRRRNIARNEAMLAALSLPQPKARASLRGKRKSAKAGARKAAGSAVPAPLRKSKRLRGEKVDSEGLLALPWTWKSCIMGNDRVSGGESRGANLTAGVDDSRIKLQVLDVEHASEKMKELDKAIRDRDESKAGTASYRHCLHRVQTMGDVRLVRRVRAIERARGKKAARKMLVFVNVLRDKSKGEVLAVAEAALDRLLRGIPMPETS
ncbi:unnamed protein product [Ascophyllum nodosum]